MREEGWRKREEREGGEERGRRKDEREGGEGKEENEK